MYVICIVQALMHNKISAFCDLLGIHKIVSSHIPQISRALIQKANGPINPYVIFISLKSQHLYFLLLDQRNWGNVTEFNVNPLLVQNRISHEGSTVLQNV